MKLWGEHVDIICSRRACDEHPETGDPLSTFCLASVIAGKPHGKLAKQQQERDSSGDSWRENVTKCITLLIVQENSHSTIILLIQYCCLLLSLSQVTGTVNDITSECCLDRSDLKEIMTTARPGLPLGLGERTSKQTFF
jgi:hypothetical protein